MDVTPKERALWMNRPGHEMNQALLEWVAARRGVGEGQREGSVIEKPIIKLGTVDGGRARHEPGRMNGLEKRYAAHLDLRKATGEILSWKFEPLKLKLAPSTFYSPDFMVVASDGRIELHETKGASRNKVSGATKPFYEDDAVIKLKVAAVMFPEFSFSMVWHEKGAGWKSKEFSK
jgi:hypothetical protein